jgi:hypothetical protein
VVVLVNYHWVGLGSRLGKQTAAKQSRMGDTRADLLPDSQKNANETTDRVGQSPEGRSG